MNVKHLQLWVHKHYDGIKLVMLSIILLFATLTFLQFSQASVREAEERATQAVKEAEDRSRSVQRGLDALRENTTNINDNTNRVAALIACLLEIHGEEQVISPEDREACQKLSDGAEKDFKTSNNAENQEEDTPKEEVRRQETTPPPAPKPQPQPDPPEEPDPPTSILPLVEEPVIGCISNVVEVCI